MTEPSLPFEQRAFVTSNEDGSARVEPIPGMGVCDFCTHVPIVASFPCGPVVIDVGPAKHVTTDPWGACQECCDLIVADDRHGLVERATSALPSELPQADVDHMRMLFAWVHGQFLQARQGPPAFLNE